MERTIREAKDLIERINARSMQHYELRVDGERDLRKSWTLYVSTYDGKNKCKVVDGNWLPVSQIINLLAGIHGISHTRVWI